VEVGGKREKVYLLVIQTGEQYKWCGTCFTRRVKEQPHDVRMNLSRDVKRGTKPCRCLGEEHSWHRKQQK
jgi:hypothetical protein